MSSILSFFASLFSKWGSTKIAELGFNSALETAKFIAWKTLIVFLLFTGSIVAVSLVLEFVFTNVYDYVSSQVSGSSLEGVNFSLSASSFFAYFVDVLRIDDALRIVVSALVTKFTFKFIPFVRL